MDRIDFTDNVLPLEYYTELAPRLTELAARGERYELFVEIKTNARKDQLRSLRNAGFTYIQPGIESSSGGLLKMMKKGNTPIGQVQFLKWCDELGFVSVYNLIFRNPGEQPEDYQELVDLIPLARMAAHRRPA